MAGSGAGEQSVEKPSRPQVSASAGDLDRVERRLERMPLERDALTLAMRQFGEDFDAVKWRAAYEALSAPERNRVVQVTANLTALIDNAVELVRFAATLTASAWPRTSIARGRKGLMLARSSMTTAARPVPATSRNFLLADALEETKAPND